MSYRIGFKEVCKNLHQLANAAEKKGQATCAKGLNEAADQIQSLGKKEGLVVSGRSSRGKAVGSELPLRNIKK